MTYSRQLKIFNRYKLIEEKELISAFLKSLLAHKITISPVWICLAIKQSKLVQ